MCHSIRNGRIKRLKRGDNKSDIKKQSSGIWRGYNDKWWFYELWLKSTWD